MKSKIINNSIAAGAGGLQGNSPISGGNTGGSSNANNGGSGNGQSKELPNIQTRSLVTGNHLPLANGAQPGGGNTSGQSTSISGVGSG